MDESVAFHAIHIERALLGRLLMSPDRGKGTLGKLRPRHFFDSRHRLTFQVVESLRKEGRSHELTTVFQRLTDRGQLADAGGYPYLAGLVDDAGTNPDLCGYAEEILRRARNRALERGISHLSNYLSSSPGVEGEVRLLDLVSRLARVGRFDVHAHAHARAEIWKQEDLMLSEFPEVDWAVHELVVEGGLTILGGKKKVGKSWFCLQIAQAVAAGNSVLEKATEQGTVIYICLEDGPARLQRRLNQQNARRDLPITYLTRLPPLDRGGLEELRQLAQTHKPRLIILDTLAAAKTGKVDENAAGPMADLLNGLRAIAQDCHVGILIVAHHGKLTTGDPGHDIRGSSASAGAADLNIGLYKEGNNHVLRTEGRDIGEAELRVEFDAATTWCWHLLGDAREIARSETEDEILRALEELGTADAGRIARHIGKTRPAVQKALKRMREQGRIPFTKDTKAGGKILYGPWDEAPQE